jgi:predicted TIM-barrel fold metal-dependent hydrolase
MSELIDTHVHVFPHVEELVTKPLLGSTPGGLRAVVGGPLRAGLAATRVVAGRLPAPSPLSVRRMSALERLVPEGAWERIEQATGVVATLSVLPRSGVDGLLRSMDKAGIARSVAIGSFALGPNDWLLAEAARSNGRLIPVVTAPALTGGATYHDWVEAFAALADRGAAGFKIHPKMEGIEAGHDSVRARFEVAAQRGLFVIIHTGCFHVPLYKTPGPVDLPAFLPVLRDHPSVNTCLAHMNRGAPEEAWSVMMDHDHVYTDTSWTTPDVLAKAVHIVGPDRVMLGSDWPLLHAGLQAEALAIAREALTGDQLRTVTVDAPRRFLGVGERS